MDRYYIISSNGIFYVVDRESSATVYSSPSRDDAIAYRDSFNDMADMYFG
jgi:hypothetical protein